MCSACDYGIRLSKYDPLTHDSPYAALNDISNLPSDQSIEFYEIGSGSVLSNLAKRSCPSFKRKSAGNKESLESLLLELDS